MAGAAGALAAAVAAAMPTAVMLARIAVAIWLFARGLDVREHHMARIAALLAAAAVYCWISVTLKSSASSLVATQSGIASLLWYAMALLVLTMLILGCLGAVLLVCDVSVWVALFCVTAGYSLQNLATGLSELLAVLGSAVGLATDAGAVFWFDEIVPFLIVCPLCYVAVVRKIDAGGLKRIEDHGMLLMMPVVILVIVGFDLVIKNLTAISDVDLSSIVMLRGLHAAACCFVIWMEYELLYRRQLQAEMRTTERLLAERGRQYEQGRQNMLAVNQRFHAIREQVHGLGERAGDGGVGSEDLLEVERALSVYDAVAHTKNEALDTVLTEKKLVCDGLGIVLTYMVDGSALGFMAPADVYALFSTALDEAIGAVEGLPEGRRSITVSVRRTLGGALVHVECPCDGMGAARQGGAQPLRETVQRYGGTVSCVAETGTLSIDVLVPEP